MPPRPPTEASILLRLAVRSGKRLARHSYIILTAGAAMSAARLERVARLKARVLELPFDLEEVAAAVKDADDDQTLPCARRARGPRAVAPATRGRLILRHGARCANSRDACATPLLLDERGFSTWSYTATGIA